MMLNLCHNFLSVLLTFLAILNQQFMLFRIAFGRNMVMCGDL
jgi:hypothetical protein